MQSLLVLIVGKIVEVVIKYLVAWGEKSIAKQNEIKKKMEAYRAKQSDAVKKAQDYEANPSDANRDDMP